MRNANRNERVQESIQRFRCGFLQPGREKLFNVLPAQELARAAQEEVGVWRDRRYAPLVERPGKRVGGRLEGGSTAAWRWGGRPVKIVDGSTVTMPYPEENQARYPQHGVQKPGLGFPIARLVSTLIDPVQVSKEELNALYVHARGFFACALGSLKIVPLDTEITEKGVKRE